MAKVLKPHKKLYEEQTIKKAQNSHYMQKNMLL